jgi:large subunit ribosomal protein L6
MSRIGKMPIELTSNVNITLSWNNIKVKGPLWELNFDFLNDLVEIKQNENSIIVNPLSDSASAIWWTTRAIINNMVVWVTEGFKKSLEINWVGYKFEIQGVMLVLSIGFSHKVNINIPKWLKLEMDEKAKNIIHIFWIDKQLVWEFASKIRSNKKPEPYKWKWIKYVWEHIIRKAGKTGSK